ncbi:MAG: transposase, partial [Candidatus Dormibacteraceae bacterium]
MRKQFGDGHLAQLLLLPPSLEAWLPEGHLARLVADVVETLDLSAIYAKHEARDGRGLGAYDSRMMGRLLIYGYCRGVASSRRMERATHEDVAFRYLAANQHPDHDTIAAFRQEHLASW